MTIYRFYFTFQQINGVSYDNLSINDYIQAVVKDYLTTVLITFRLMTIYRFGTISERIRDVLIIFRLMTIYRLTGFVDGYADVLITFRLMTIYR